MNGVLPRRITAYLYGVAGLFVVAVLAAGMLMTWKLREMAISDSQGQAIRFVGGAEAALNRNLLGVDLLLASMGELLKPSSAGSVLADAAQPPVSQLMRVSARQNLLVRYIAFLNAQGEVVASSERRGSQLAIRLPAGFLELVLAQPAPTLVISSPIVSASTSQRVVYFARGVQLIDGSQLVAVAEVQLSLLTTILTQGADIDGLEVTLEQEGGHMLASVPPRDDLSGRPILPAISESTSESGPVQMAARLSGAPAIVVARPTLHRNLVIVASIPLHAVLQEWRGQRAFILGAALLFISMIGLVSVLAHVHLRRQWRSKATLDQALESMVDGFVLLDPNDRVVTWNRRFVDLFPWARDVVGPAVSFERITEKGEGQLEIRSAALAPEPTALPNREDLKPVPGERELILSSGLIIQAIKSRTPEGGLVCVYHDVTERRRHIADIIDGKAQLQATLDALPDVLLELGLDGRCHRFQSPRFADPCIDVAEPVGLLISEMLPPDAAGEVMAAVQESYVSGLSSGRQFERHAAQGTAWFEMSVSRKAIGEGADARFIVIVRNITERKSAAREIEHLAFYDGLTGLPNRPMLLHRLKAAIDHNIRGSRHGALLFLDLDHFKTLNDAQGRIMGNLLLKQVAIRLLSLVRDGDTVARLSGDEFVVLLENLNEDRAVAALQTKALGEAMLLAVSEPFQLSGYSHRGTCSIGATLFSDEALSLEELLKQADIAMYYTKTDGGNALRFFETAMQTSITARATLEAELHAAMAAKEFTLHYQRQVDAAGQVVGAEVLIRWQHPNRGLVPPAGFIELAETTGLIIPMGLWVLEQACFQLERWSHHPKRRELKLAVNVSARQFRSNDFTDQVREILIRTGADPSKLKLELTESLLQDKVAETVRKMKSLAAIGIEFSMDDFGTGYSSLSYMTQLPLHQVKIDKFFVQSIGLSPKVELIIQTIIGMAQSLDLGVVAEGVETREQLEFLQKNGCKFFQGYLFGKPMEFDKLERELDTNMLGWGIA